MKKCLITLVHGTFARNAEWTLEGSAFSKSITEGINAEMKFYRLLWSGRNSATDRDFAAKQLEKLLSKQRQEYPDCLQVVVGHSHGGNIVGSALWHWAFDPYTFKKMAAVFLATPFIVARVRSNFVTIAQISVLALCTLLTIGAHLAALTFYPWDPSFLGIMTACFYLLAVASTIIAFYVFPSFGDRKYQFGGIASSISSCYLPSYGKYLFIRMSGDEAESVLSTAQFGSWLVSKALSPFLKCLEFFNRLDPSSEFRQYLLAAIFMLPQIGFVAVFLTFLSYHANATDTLRYKTNWLLDQWALSPVGYVLLAVYLIAVAVEILASAILLIFYLVCLACHRSFGRRSFLTALFVEVGVEPVPTGKHLLNHVEWGSAHNRPLDSKMMSHSEPYRNVLCISLIREWLVELLKDNPMNH